jgi:hypothetical protein
MSCVAGRPQELGENWVIVGCADKFEALQKTPILNKLGRAISMVMLQAE